MTLFVKPKNTEKKGPAADDVKYSVFTSASTNADGEQSVSELLVPDEAAKASSTSPGSRPGKESLRAMFSRNGEVSDVDVVERAEAQASAKPAKGLGLFSRKEKPKAEPVEPHLGTETVPGSSAGKSFKDRFGKKPAAAATTPVEKPEKKSLFGRKKEKSSGASAAPKAPKPPTKFFGMTFGGEKVDNKVSPEELAKLGRRKRPKKGTLHLALTLGTETVVYYEMTADTLANVQPKDFTEAAAFSKADVRFPADAAMAYKTAVDLALSEGVGETVRIVHAAKQLGATYATSVERLDLTPVRLGPGLMLVELALRKQERPTVPHTVSVLLKDGASPLAALILYYVDGNGEFSLPQVTVASTNLGFTLQEFKNSRGLTSDSPVVELSNSDLLDVADQLQLYPAEAEWNGISVRTLLGYGVIVAAAAAVGTTGFAAYEHMTLAGIRAQTKTITAKTAQFDKKNQALISESLVSFGRAQSLNAKEVSERAANLWVPRTTMTVEANASSAAFNITMPLTVGGYVNNRPSALAELNNQEIQQLLKLTPPEGCSKTMPGVSGGVNVLQVTVNCEAVVGSLARYRND